MFIAVCLLLLLFYVIVFMQRRPRVHGHVRERRQRHVRGHVDARGADHDRVPDRRPPGSRGVGGQVGDVVRHLRAIQETQTRRSDKKKLLGIITYFTRVCVCE